MVDLDKGRERHIRSNARVKNYIIAEFVAVPPDFKIESHLHLRENFGIFEIKDIHLNQVGIISDVVKNSAVFSSMNNSQLDPKCCMFFLYILNELGLVLSKVDNPIRRHNQDTYLQFAKRWEDDQFNVIRGQEVMRISFLVVNIVHLLSEEIIGQATKAIQNVQKYQMEVNKAKQFNLD